MIWDMDRKSEDRDGKAAWYKLYSSQATKVPNTAFAFRSPCS